MSGAPAAPVVSVVAIGASAGGVPALARIASARPAGFARAVLVVLHVPPDARGE
ncbi:MAG TPA: chemotaxis protein CheB, partial [Burkholderiaceae bacterium]|nr:chemotaxis protein CheB [Burkholderiaceae bacterium]